MTRTRSRRATGARRPRLPAALAGTLGGDWVLSLEGGSQAKYYEPSDWHTAIAAGYALNEARNYSRSIAHRDTHAREWRLMARMLLATGQSRRAVHLDDEPTPTPPPSDGEPAPEHRARVAGHAHVQ